MQSIRLIAAVLLVAHKPTPAPVPQLPVTLLLKEKPMNEYARKLQEAGYST